ncbi:hypothetical protein TL16_g07582 [Triparma laevis f. inornata]|nr:hypothetical protein TL16_g07582 [Triparma laevis f. inornata]
MSTYGSLASSHLSLTGGPNGNPFRSKMSTSLGSLETTASYANTYSIMSTLSQASQNASSLIGAVAKGEKSTRLTNEQKLDCLAVFGLVLLKAPNNRPGQTTVLELGTALATTAASNPDPNLISRSQFTSVLMSHLDHVTPLNCANLFSTFDPNGRGRLNHLSFLCTLLSIHRPSMNNMMSGSYHYCRDNVKSVTVLSRCVQVVERGRGGVTLKDLKLILKGCCLKAEDRRAIDVQIDQISTVLKRPFEKFSRPVVLTEDEVLGPNGLLIRNSFVLDVFQEQLLHMQEEVSGRQAAIKRK